MRFTISYFLVAVLYYEYYLLHQVALKDSFTFNSALLLTGTPLQNNTEVRTSSVFFFCVPGYYDKDAFFGGWGGGQFAA